MYDGKLFFFIRCFLFYLHKCLLRNRKFVQDVLGLSYHIPQSMEQPNPYKILKHILWNATIPLETH